MEVRFDPVCAQPRLADILTGTDRDIEPEDEDTLAEIDPTNIVGSRTRGKTIDFAKAAQELGEDEDEDDDEDFNDPDDEMKD